jgi:hypothetical protein
MTEPIRLRDGSALVGEAAEEYQAAVEEAQRCGLGTAPEIAHAIAAAVEAFSVDPEEALR